MLAGFKAPSKIQLEDTVFTVRSAVSLTAADEFWHHTGNRNFAYLNRNDAKRNLNLNYLENDFNDNWRFAVVRQQFTFPSSPLAGMFFPTLFSMTNRAGRFPLF